MNSVNIVFLLEAQIVHVCECQQVNCLLMVLASSAYSKS